VLVESYPSDRKSVDLLADNSSSIRKASNYHKMNLMQQLNLTGTAVDQSVIEPAALIRVKLYICWCSRPGERVRALSDLQQHQADG
jgi:hypothetical protein